MAEVQDDELHRNGGAPGSVELGDFQGSVECGARRSDGDGLAFAMSAVEETMDVVDILRCYVGMPGDNSGAFADLVSLKHRVMFFACTEVPESEPVFFC